MVSIGLISPLFFLSLEFYTLNECYQTLTNQKTLLKKKYEIYTENDNFCHYSLNLLLIAKIIKIYQQSTCQ